MWARLWVRRRGDGCPRRDSEDEALSRALLAIAVIPLYLYASGASTLLLGALFMGWTGAGIFGIAPSYLTERFPTSVRGVGTGFAYHAGAAAGSVTPTVLGALQVGGWQLRDAMALCIAVAAALVATVIWLGPETRAQRFTAGD
jgi:MFS family permease